MTLFAAMCGILMIESGAQRSAFRRVRDGLIAPARNVLRYAVSSLSKYGQRLRRLTNDDCKMIAVHGPVLDPHCLIRSGDHWRMQKVQ